MNFLDTYEIAGTGTNTPPQPNQPEQSLNEEVSQVIGQLGRFWGGFRRQSQTALETARKDLGEVVGKLTAETLQSSTGESSTDASPSQGEAEAGPSSEGDKTPPSAPPEQGLPTSPSQSLFTRLSSSLPPNIVTTVQAHLPDSLKNASQSIDFAQLRTNLSTEFQRVQGVTRAQAEEYVHKSEGLLRDAMREAGEVLREAVKVIPPDEGESVPGTAWDGTDAWMVSSYATTSDAKGKGKQVESSLLFGRPSGEGLRSVATRAEALLKQLKYDPAVIRADPEAEESVKELYSSWIEAEVRSKEGGLDDKEWTDKITNTLAEVGDGEALQTTHDALVPSEITNETFWKRYFFRVYQVEKEEEKRKALLQGSVENDELFSWEDDEEDITSLSKNARSMNDSVSSDNTLGVLSKSSRPTKKGPGSSERLDTSETTSPRLSSEDSYDLVSSGNVSTAGGEKVRAKKGGDDDADSDWE